MHSHFPILTCLPVLSPVHVSHCCLCLLYFFLFHHMFSTLTCPDFGFIAQSLDLVVHKTHSHCCIQIDYLEPRYPSPPPTFIIYITSPFFLIHPSPLC